MYSSMSSTAWSPGPPTDRSESSSPPPPPATRRLRGLSYLRSYTHTHILSRDSQNSTSRSARALSPAGPAPTSGPRPPSPSARRRTIHGVPTGFSEPSIWASERGLQSPPGGQPAVSPSTAEAPSPTAAPPLAAASLNAPSEPSATMGRTRSATVGNVTDMPHAEGPGASRPRNEAPATANRRDEPHGVPHQPNSIRFTAHQDPRAPRPSLVFSPLSRILPSGKEIIKVGRYSERDNLPAQAVNVLSAAPVGFKSKVVSRRHCEFWCTGGRWFIKDVKSSSGTFLNHIRLSPPGTESKPYPVNDGDIVQLGIDFKGGEEMIFRCVKIRVDLNKSLQNAPSSFNVQSHKRLQALNNYGKPPTGSSSQDCSICLGPIAPCQSLFVAPCSHTWHYKCIRVIINGPHWPHFICPNCRTVADLEAELDDPYAQGEWDVVEAVDETTGVQPPESFEPPALAHQPREVNSSEPTDVAPEPTSDAFDQDQTTHSDDGVVETSDDSDLGPGIHHAVEGMSYLNIDEAPELPLLSPRPAISNATTPPVNIAGSNSVAVGLSSRLENPDAGIGRDRLRTPSPGRGPPSGADGIPSSEGPLTPRNDAGPFIFDGSAGRLGDLTPLDPECQPTL